MSAQGAAGVRCTMFSWRRKRKAAGQQRSAGSDPDERLGLSVVVLEEGEAERLAAEHEAGRTVLRRVVAEAVIRQDEAEELLTAIRARGPLGELAPRGGKLSTRFVELRNQLPEVRDVQLRRQIVTVRSVLDHHTMLLSTALDLLSVDWRSSRVEEQLDGLRGLGEPAAWLDAIRDELTQDERAVG